MATNNKDFKVKNGLSVAGGGTFGAAVTVGTPTENGHAATKQYVDENAGGGPTLSSNPPSSPVQGDQWYDIDTGATYIYYDGYWVEMSSGAEQQALQGASPIGFDANNAIISIDLGFFEDHKIMTLMGAI